MKTPTFSGLTQSELVPTQKAALQLDAGKTLQAGNLDGHVGFEQLSCRRCRPARLEIDWHLSLLTACTARMRGLLELPRNATRADGDCVRP